MTTKTITKRQKRFSFKDPEFYLARLELNRIRGLIYPYASKPRLSYWLQRYYELFEEAYGVLVMQPLVYPKDARFHINTRIYDIKSKRDGAYINEEYTDGEPLTPQEKAMLFVFEWVLTGEELPNIDITEFEAHKYLTKI